MASEAIQAEAIRALVQQFRDLIATTYPIPPGGQQVGPRINTAPSVHRFAKDDILPLVDKLEALAVLASRETPERDPIVMAADAAKAACILRIQRAIAATGDLHAMPLTAEECVTILEHMAWDEIPEVLGETPPTPDPARED